MSGRIWKIEVLGKPTPAHAADAVEIIGGEAVRRVTLSAVDHQAYLVVVAEEKVLGYLPTAEQLGSKLTLPSDEAAAALRRLIAVGLVTPPEQPTLQ